MKTEDIEPEDFPEEPEDFFIDNIKGTSKGFIETYVEDIWKQFSDAPKESCEASALALMSICAGHNISIFDGLSSGFKIVLSKDIASKGFPLNIWLIMIGKSRVTRKSFVDINTTDILTSIDEDMILPASFTPEALIQELYEKEKTEHPQGIWINDEISGFYQALKSKKHMATVDTILSSLYSCKYYAGYSTIGRGRTPLKNPYITIFHASTFILPTFFDEYYMIQGFANRFFYIIAKRDTHKSSVNKLSKEGKTNLFKIKTWLEDIYNLDKPIGLVFSDKALKMFDDFELNTVEKDIEKQDGTVYEGWIANTPEYVKKFAGLYALSDCYNNEVMEESLVSMIKGDVISIEEKHVKRAIKRVYGKGLEDFKQVAHIMQTRKQSRVVQTDEGLIEMTYQIIAGYMPKGATRTNIYRKMNIIQEKLEPVIDTLLKQDRIKVEMKKQIGAGKPTTLYFTK